jgi:hypothetical protein
VPIKWINPEKSEVKEEVVAEPRVAAEPSEPKTNAEPSESRTEGAESKKPEGPRVVKYDSILDGKIYKERTARGGVKWYLGEEIDEEKLAKNKILLDDGAKEIIDLSREVAPKSSRLDHDKKNQDQKKTDKQVGESSGNRPEKEHDKKADGKSQPKNDAETVVKEDGENIKHKTAETVEPQTEKSEFAVEEDNIKKTESPIKPKPVTADDKEDHGQPVKSDPKHLEEGQSVKIGE